MRVSLLHGIDKELAVLDVKQKLWRETGVMATIHGWESKTAESQEKE